MKVVQQLSQRGYVDTARGKNGGMRLRLQPHRINVGRVVRDMGRSDLALVERFGPDNRCIISPTCAMKTIFVEAQDAFFSILDRYTLADLVAYPKVLRRVLHVRLIEDSV